MRSLVSELTRRGLGINVKDPRAIQKVYSWLSELGLGLLVEVSTTGIEVPDAVLSSGDPAVFACWLAMTLTATRRVALGVDLGSRHLGLAAVVGGVLAFSCVARNPKRLVHVISALIGLGAEVHVRIGYSSHLAALAKQLYKKLEAVGAQVELLGNEQVKESVVLGDFTQLGKLSSHELDALKIALARDAGTSYSRASTHRY
ncbi:MAG: hypothetical protein QW407_01215 [Thermofilaceae archaeon]